MLICDLCGTKLNPEDSNTYSDTMYTTHYINEIDEDIYDETNVSLCEKCHERVARARNNAVQEAEMRLYQNRKVKDEDGQVIIERCGKAIPILYDHSNVSCLFRSGCKFPGTCEECVSQSQVSCCDGKIK